MRKIRETAVGNSKIFILLYDFGPQGVIWRGFGGAGSEAHIESWIEGNDTRVLSAFSETAELPSWGSALHGDPIKEKSQNMGLF